MYPDRPNPERGDTTPAECDFALSDLSLRAASSKAIFERGQTYAPSGAVSDLTPLTGTEPGVAAEVLGTDCYSTEVWLDEGEVAGSFDCPSANEGGFCKHQLAVALVWREHLAGRTPPIASASARIRPKQGAAPGSCSSATIGPEFSASHVFDSGRRSQSY